MNLLAVLVPVQVKHIYFRPDEPFELAVEFDLLRLYLVHELGQFARLLRRLLLLFLLFHHGFNFCPQINNKFPQFTSNK